MMKAELGSTALFHKKTFTDNFFIVSLFFDWSEKLPEKVTFTSIYYNFFKIQSTILFSCFSLWAINTILNPNGGNIKITQKEQNSQEHGYHYSLLFCKTIVFVLYP